MSEIAIAVAVFTGLVLVLTLLVIGARRVLLPRGTVAILVNGRTRVEAAAGETLLAALAAGDIYLPAACGGRGSCGQCRVHVERGNRRLLPTETAHINRREAASGLRLACMLRIHEDLEIQVPGELLSVERRRCRVRSNRNVTTYLKELEIEIVDGPALEFRAGEYVLVEAPPHEVRFSDFEIDAEYYGEWERYQLLSLVSESNEANVRAYSLASYPGEEGAIKLVVRIATPPYDAPAGTPPGVVSSWLFSLVPGDELGITGPYGDFHATDTQKEMVFIAGGAGIAPMRSILFDQLVTRGTDREISFWYGARNVRELCYQDEFDGLAREHANFRWFAALSEPAPDTVWDGYTGFIHAVVYQHYLRTHPAPEDAEYYLCGPPLMTAGALHMLDELGVDRESIYLDEFGP